MKKIVALFVCVLMILSAFSVASFAITDTVFDGETARTTTELYDGVICTHISLSEKSSYGQQEIWIVEFDPTREDLAIDVTGIGQYSNKLGTVQKTMEEFLKNNGQNKVPISGINGDLWMVTYAHARVEGSGTEYGGAKDPVVTHSLTLPRGLDIYNGEIITSPHTTAETPYEGAFDCFGITADGRTVLGTPTLSIQCKNLSQEGFETVKLTGLNRLPANKAIMLYSDKGCEDNYSLDDAYEVIIDCDYDYKITDGSAIKGKVTKICKPGDTNEKMKENRLILTARGTKQIGKVEGIKVGDELEFSFQIKGSKKEGTIWSEVVNAVGGHIKLMVDGKPQSNGDTSKYPTSIIGNMPNGNVVFITSDGRQPGYAVGMQIGKMPKFCQTLGIQNCFLLDGGGSATMVNINKDGNYELVNRPSDTDDKGNHVARTVVNSIILSYIKPTPEPTEEPTAEPTAEVKPTDNPGTEDKKSGCGSFVAGASAVLLCTALCLPLLKKRNDEE